VRDRGNGLKTQPMVYRWMGRAGWVRNTPTSNEAIRMKTVNHKPMNHPKTTPTPSRQERGQLVQASEKAYKVAEEVVKALAEVHGLEEYKKALREGRWYTYELSSASIKLSKTLGEWVLRGWEAGYELHVWGFHEAKYGREEVEVLVGIVREMFEKAKGTLAGKAYQT